MSFSQIIRSLSIFLVPTLIFGLAALYFTVQFGLVDTQLWFNAYHNPFLDELMPLYTYLGDGLVFLFLLPIFFFLPRKALLALFLGGLLTLLFTSALKAYFNEPRPALYFEQMGVGQELRLVPGVKTHLHHSFPSGHTTAAFAAWGILAFFSRRKAVQLLCFGIALGVAYSRIYLSQHFLRDVGAGSILGAFVALNALFWSLRFKADWANKNWWNGGR